MAQPLPSRGDIVSCLVEADRALHAKEIATRLSVREASYARLLELLDQLSLDRSIRRLAGSRFKAQPTGGLNTSWEGVLSVNPRGFGFVSAAGHDDVYVPADGIGGALHGDRVAIVVVAKTARGTEGRIERIVARRNPRVAGVLHKRGKAVWLEPDDTRVRGPVVVTTGADLGKEGDAAVVRITRFPELTDENAEGELLAVLGVPGDPKTEVAKILVREQIVEEHPEESLREAEAMAARLPQMPATSRVDLRAVPLPTIDPEDARDHDDAVWVERTETGYRAWIAIADVSEYVQPGSALDREASARGFTIYLPDRAIPMLPAALSADLCSLLPEHDRLCLCVIVDLDRRGVVERFDIVEGVMRSAAMLTYGGVARALGFSETPARSAQAEAFRKDLRVVDELARKLRRARMARGALDMNLPEPRVVLDETSGAPLEVYRRAQDPGIKRAYEMVEELMLLANELVAQWLCQRRAVAIYRVHGMPDQAKLERLVEVAATFGAPLEVEESVTPEALAKWLAGIENNPRQSVLEMLLLRSLKQAAYDIVNIGHFGLASDSYLHFTSPIRRYPDLVVHRTVKSLLRGGKAPTSAAHIEEIRGIATAASSRERAAIEVEREVVDLYRACFMRDKIGQIFEGTVSALVGSGVFVVLDAPFVDVLVKHEELGPDHYELGEDELSVIGHRSGDRVSLGDRMAVRIEDVAILRRAVLGRRMLDEAAVEVFEGKERRRGGAGRRSRSHTAKVLEAVAPFMRGAATTSAKRGATRGKTETPRSGKVSSAKERGRGRDDRPRGSGKKRRK